VITPVSLACGRDIGLDIGCAHARWHPGLDAPYQVIEALAGV